MRDVLDLLLQVGICRYFNQDYLSDKIEQQMTSSNLKLWCQIECGDVIWTQLQSTRNDSPSEKTSLVGYEPTTFGEHDQCSYHWATGVLHTGIASTSHIVVWGGIHFWFLSLVFKWDHSILSDGMISNLMTSFVIQSCQD
jgi:hypothetical protein